jgi:hypothetical protein
MVQMNTFRWLTAFLQQMTFEAEAHVQQNGLKRNGANQTSTLA